VTAILPKVDFRVESAIIGRMATISEIMGCVALVLSGVLAGCSTKPAVTVPTSNVDNSSLFDEYTVSTRSATRPKIFATRTVDKRIEAENYFRNYLANCETNAIHCLWFHKNDPTSGAVMTIHLDHEVVFSVTDDYNWAFRVHAPQKLTYSQAMTLRQITRDLPASEKNADFDKSVFISKRNGKNVEVYQYDRSHAPAVVQRIYDIGGGPL